MKNGINGIEAEIEILIDWPTVMALPRYAGGHDEIMKGVFGPDGAKVAAFYNEGDYQGQVAVALELPDGRCVVMTDWYGSCSGCDAYEDASDEEIRRLVSGLVQGSRVFPNVSEAKAWSEGEIDTKEFPELYPFESARRLDWAALGLLRPTDRGQG